MSQKKKDNAYLGTIQDILNSCQNCGGKLGQFSDLCDECVKDIEGEK